MSTENEELIAEARAWRKTALPPTPYGDGHIVLKLADALEAAAKPVTVNTVEELDALPRESVVIIGNRVWQKLGGVMPYEEWQAADGGFARSSTVFADVHSHYFPITVLHTPRQEGK